jgi:serine/threonine protein kinase
LTEKWQTPEIKLSSESDHQEQASANAIDADVKVRIVAEPHHSIPGFADLHLIAEGASGCVFSARREKDSAQVAIKIYKKELTPNAEALRRFEHEVATLSKLSHPNIVKIMSFGTTSDAESYIVMELVEGVSIRTLLDTEGVFQPQRAVVVAREICRALGAAHAQGIIHRDLKPNNIILDSNNVAKVVDFGVAKAVGASNDTITQYGAIIGTPAYMSPEQCLGQRVYERSDIYSLGCTLFEMLTGIKAFESTTTMEALAKQIDTNRSHIQTHLGSTGIAQDLQTIVMTCLNRDSDKRYKTVAELDHDLSGFLLGLPLTFSGTKKSSPLPFFRSWSLIACVAAIVIAALFIQMNLGAIKNALEINKSMALATPLITMSSGPPIEIRNRLNGKIIYSNPGARTLKAALKEASDNGVSLSYADLKQADLTQLKVSSLDLSNADLTGAKLTQARLTDVNLSGAFLNDATLIQANLLAVNMRNAHMHGAKLTQMQAPGLVLEGADLSDATLIQTRLERANCTGTNFTNAKLTQADFRDANLSFANFAGVNMQMIGRSGVTNANLYGAKYVEYPKY